MACSILHLESMQLSIVVKIWQLVSKNWDLILQNFSLLEIHPPGVDAILSFI